MWDEVYEGPMPEHAKSVDLARWAWWHRRRMNSSVIPEGCTMYLGFGSNRVNLGGISAGGIKAFIDCLYPFIGGQAGAPDDHRISKLIVEKGLTRLEPNQVDIKIWEKETMNSPIPEEPQQASHDASQREVGAERLTRSHARLAINNPCKLGSRKALVCDAALKQESVATVRQGLDRIRQGAGEKLSEYIGDLRSENDLDIQIVDGKLICRGKL